MAVRSCWSLFSGDVTESGRGLVSQHVGVYLTFVEKVRVGETKLNSGWRRPRRRLPPCDDAPCCSCLVSALFYSCAFLSSLSLFFPPSFLFPAQTSLAP